MTGPKEMRSGPDCVSVPAAEERLIEAAGDFAGSGFTVNGKLLLEEFAEAAGAGSCGKALEVETLAADAPPHCGWSKRMVTVPARRNIAASKSAA